MSKKAAASPENTTEPATELRATSKTVPLPSGLFVFAVRKASPERAAGELMLPAMHVAPGPGCPANVVEFVGSANSQGTWLYSEGDRLVVRVSEPGATLVVTSVRADGTQPLDVALEPVAGTARAVTAVAQPETASAASAAGNADGSLKAQLNLHIRNYGDLGFASGDWAGLVAENLWVEAMGIVVQDRLGSHDVEYKTLSASGFESPWLSDGALSGSKGRGMPLIGFAIRLRPEAAGQYDCEYSGYFQSGATVGPVRNGVPCRSKVASDPLVGVKLRIAPRAVAPKASAEPAAVLKAVEKEKPSASSGPRFGKLRQEAAKADARPTAKGKATPKRTK